MLHGRQDRIQTTVDQYLGHCSVTPYPFEQLAFFLNDLIRDPTWTLQEVEEVGQSVLMALDRAASSRGQHILRNCLQAGTIGAPHRI